MAIVVLDIAEFKELYPAFVNVSDIIITNQFAMAELMCNNTEASIVVYEPSQGKLERKLLLYLLLAHMLELRERGTVGTLTSASEGSVSTSFYVEQRKNAGYYTQTEYGYSYWTLTAKYRLGGLIV